MNDPRVSVVMSVHNCQRYVGQAIRSVLGQTFRNFEFIIINDASTDRTDRVIASFSDERMRIFHHSRNEGLTRSLIEGIAHSRSPYIARIDADDLSHPMRIEVLHDILANDPQTGIAGSFVEFMTSHGRTYWKWELPQDHGSLRRRFLMGESFSHGATMFRKDLYEKAGGYRPQFIFGQDLDLWLRMSEHCRVTVVDQFLYRQRRSPDRLTTRNLHRQTQYLLLALVLTEQRLRKGKDCLQADSRANEEELFKMVWEHYRSNDREFFQRYMLKSSDKIEYELRSGGKYFRSLLIKAQTKSLLKKFRKFCGI